jgi:hypothetical protein
VIFLFPAHHPLQLLRGADGVVVLFLRNPARVQKLLDLRLGVALEHLPELLEPLENVSVPHLRVPYLLVQWITH